jgi:hypothetical protein
MQGFISLRITFSSNRREAPFFVAGSSPALGTIQPLWLGRNSPRNPSELAGHLSDNHNSLHNRHRDSRTINNGKYQNVAEAHEEFNEVSSPVHPTLLPLFCIPFQYCMLAIGTSRPILSAISLE